MIIHCFFSLAGADGWHFVFFEVVVVVGGVVVVALRLPFVFGDDGVEVVVPFVFPLLPCSFDFVALRAALLVLTCPFAISTLLLISGL